MPIEQLTINGKDAYTTWGVSLSNTGLSALMTPPSNKDYIENDSRLEHGSRIILSDMKVASRQVTLTINLVAKSESDFFTKYASFCEELENGNLNIKTSFQPNTVYHMVYVSCNQFSQFMRGIASFTLKLIEPNPKNRE